MFPVLVRNSVAQALMIKAISRTMHHFDINGSVKLLIMNCGMSMHYSQEHVFIEGFTHIVLGEGEISQQQNSTVVV